MRKKLSDSCVHIWPDRAAVERDLLRWVEEQSALHPELRRAGYFGSYAAGRWGVGSDLDVVLLVQHSPLPFWQRTVQWPLETMIVPAEALIYTQDEWRQKDKRQIPLAADVCWVWSAETAGGDG